MAFRSYPRWLLASLLLTLLTAPRLAAQNVLVVESQGKGYVVRKVRDGRAYAEKDGKLVPMNIQRCGLKPVPEFFPAYISVNNLQVRTSHVEMMDQAAEINHTFHFAADFSSTYALENVFLALELNTDRSGKMVFFYEVGELGPGRSRALNIHVPTAGAIGEGKFQMHLFTDGAEVFHSHQPLFFRDNMLDRMVAKRIAGVQDALPQPFFGPTPEYPKALRKAGTKGSVLLSIRITRTGAVLDPVVKSATDPAFAEAAVAAVRVWRFLPKVEKGHAKEMTVDLPFEFSPPPDDKES